MRIFHIYVHLACLLMKMNDKEKGKLINFLWYNSKLNLKASVLKRNIASTLTLLQNTLQKKECFENCVATRNTLHISALLERRPWNCGSWMNGYVPEVNVAELHARRGRIPTCFRRLAWTSCLRGERQPTTSVGAAVFWRCLPKWVSRDIRNLSISFVSTCVPLALSW
jgi:hypothetical protein